MTGFKQGMTLTGALAIGCALAALSGGVKSARAEEPKTLKFATLAPEGSSWMKLIHEWATNVEKRVPGLKINFFAGGVAGDERDAVRKMRLGQINGAAITAIGLGLIQPEVRVFELPFLFKNQEEMLDVRAQLDADIKKKFEDKGYILLNWGDVGPVHLFTNIPVQSKDDLPKLKIWEWTDDPLVRELFKELGVKGVALGVPDVLPSLQTGLIDACYGSPLSTLALQWHSKVKFMTSMTISQSIGAQVMTKAAWEALSPDARKAFEEESKKLGERLQKVVREDNTKSLEKMKLSAGLKVIETPPALVGEFENKAHGVWKELVGKVYTQEFLDHVQKLLAEHRASHK